MTKCSMVVVRFLALVLAVAVAMPAAAQKDDYVTIYGAKNPELLPEYLVWQNVLAGLGIMKTKQLPPPHTLTASAAEWDLMFAAGVWHLQQREECMQRQQKRVDALRTSRKPTLTEIDAAQKEVIVECRQEVLDRVSALLDKLSEDARASLLAWAEASKPGMFAKVLRSELEFFRKPR